jgi:hypothetical protein
MEPEGSLPCSQEPVTGHYPESDEFNPHPPNRLHKIYFNKIIPSTPKSSEWSLSFRLPNQNFVCTSYLPHALYMSISFDLP